jgi:hypothetical protein
MTGSRKLWIGLWAAIFLPPAMATSGCRSHHVETTVENRTGSAIELLEVDYPNASYGADSLASGGDFHYRIQIQGSGPLKVQYTNAGHVEQITGPDLSEGQQGRLQIVLLPGGKATFALN